MCYVLTETMRNFRQALGLSALVLLGCAGSSATGGSAGAAGAAETGGPASGGGNSGGGANSAGAASVAGAAAGGASTGGASTGGASTGGASTGEACKSSSECTACRFPTAPRQASDCYCASCASASLTKASCDANQAAWEAVCSRMVRPCPAIACTVPPTPACAAGKCTFVR